MPPQSNDRPIAITSVGQSPIDEQRGRQVQYGILMGIRVLCFIVAVAVPIMWIRVIAFLGAFLLPWFGVVGANAVRRRTLKTPGFIPQARRALTRGGS